MPAEDDLRALFSAGTESDRVAPIDTDRVIARSRARRRPRQLAVGAVSVLAVATVLLVGVQTWRIAPEISASTRESGGSALAPQSAPSAGSDATKLATANTLSRCGGSVAAMVPSASGLTLTVDFPATAATVAGTIEGTVHLANRGTERMVGSTPARPAITLSQGGMVLWHSNGPTDSAARHVDLAPGQSIGYLASFRPVRCAAADEGAGSFRADLPAVPSGAYDLSAAIGFIPDTTATGSATAVELVSGPTAGIDLR